MDEIVFNYSLKTKIYCPKALVFAKAIDEYTQYMVFNEKWKDKVSKIELANNEDDLKGSDINVYSKDNNLYRYNCKACHWNKKYRMFSISLKYSDVIDDNTTTIHINDTRCDFISILFQGLLIIASTKDINALINNGEIKIIKDMVGLYIMDIEDLRKVARLSNKEFEIDEKYRNYYKKIIKTYEHIKGQCSIEEATNILNPEFKSIWNKTFVMVGI